MTQLPPQAVTAIPSAIEKEIEVAVYQYFIWRVTQLSDLLPLVEKKKNESLDTTSTSTSTNTNTNNRENDDEKSIHVTVAPPALDENVSMSTEVDTCTVVQKEVTTTTDDNVKSNTDTDTDTVLVQKLVNSYKQIVTILNECHHVTVTDNIDISTFTPNLRKVFTTTGTAVATKTTDQVVDESSNKRSRPDSDSDSDEVLSSSVVSATSTKKKQKLINNDSSSDIVVVSTNNETTGNPEHVSLLSSKTTTSECDETTSMYNDSTNQTQTQTPILLKKYRMYMKEYDTDRSSSLSLAVDNDDDDDTNITTNHTTTTTTTTAVAAAVTKPPKTKREIFSSSSLLLPRKKQQQQQQQAFTIAPCDKEYDPVSANNQLSILETDNCNNKSIIAETVPSDDKIESKVVKKKMLEPLTAKSSSTITSASASAIKNEDDDANDDDEDDEDGVSSEDDEEEEEQNVIKVRSNKINKTWKERYEQIIAFKKEFGHCRVVYSYFNGLGKWVANQRTNYRLKKIPDDRIKKLNKLGFDWTVRGNTDLINLTTNTTGSSSGGNGTNRNSIGNSSWDEHFKDLLEFKDINGHCRVVHSNPSGLGIWVANQRTLYRLQKMKQDRIDRLNSINFEWSIRNSMNGNGSNSASWDEHYKELQAFQKVHGHCRVVHSDPSGLGVWVANQRSFYREGKMKVERSELLLAIGFEWNIRNDTWDERYNELVLFQKEHGHCKVKHTYTTGLGKWVACQRMLFREGKLINERNEKLLKIGFELSVRNANETSLWDTRYKEMIQFRNKYGHCKVPYDYPGKLTKWVSNQRSCYKEGRLSKERYHKLNTIGFVWNIVSTREKKPKKDKSVQSKIKTDDTNDDDNNNKDDIDDTINNISRHSTGSSVVNDDDDDESRHSTHSNDVNHDDDDETESDEE